MTNSEKRDIIANILLAYDPYLQIPEAESRAQYILDALEVQPIIEPQIDYEEYDAE